jgi:hypothetical protein
VAPAVTFKRDGGVMGEAMEGGRSPALRHMEEAEVGSGGQKWTAGDRHRPRADGRA